MRDYRKPQKLDLSGWQSAGRMEFEIVKLMNPHLAERAKAMTTEQIPSPQPAPLIVVFPRGQLNEADKAALSEAGVIAVEADDPKAVQQLQLAHPLNCQALTGDAIVRAALSAMAAQPCETDAGRITSAGRASHSFVTMLSNSLESA